MARTRKRLIDLIPSTIDRVDVPSDWSWLMEPFIRSFHLSAEEAAKSAYVDVASSFDSLRYLSRKIEATLALGQAYEDLRHNLDILITRNRPILLVGEPGVGKSTWILHFFARPWIKKQTYHYILNGAEIKSALSERDTESYMRKCLRDGLVDAMKGCAAALNITVAVGNLQRLDDPDRVEEAIRETAGELRRRSRPGWVIFDNVDRKDRNIQKTAIDYAKNLCGMGLHALVAIRPYTLGCDQVMDDLPCVKVPPPAIDALMRTRIKHALEGQFGRDLVAQMRAGTGANLRWTGGLVDNEAALRRLWLEVAKALSELRTLREHLFYIHLADLHEITEDLRELLTSGYFCKEMIRRLSGEIRSEHEFLTAYFRGDYWHHRHTIHSGQDIVNIYEAPSGSDRTNRLLVVRILQFLRRLGSDGDPVNCGALKRKLQHFGYDPDVIDPTLAMLVKRRLVIEVRRLIDWNEPELRLLDSDELVVSECGTYYLDFMSENPRYVQAMSDVTHMDGTVVEKMRRITRSADDDFHNAALLMDHVANILENENSRLADAGQVKDFFDFLDIGKGFFQSGVLGCHYRVQQLHEKGRVTNAVKTMWDSLLRRANAIRDLREKLEQSA